MQVFETLAEKPPDNMRLIDRSIIRAHLQAAAKKGVGSPPLFDLVAGRAPRSTPLLTTVACRSQSRGRRARPRTRRRWRHGSPSIQRRAVSWPTAATMTARRLNFSRLVAVAATSSTSATVKSDARSIPRSIAGAISSIGYSIISALPKTRIPIRGVRPQPSRRIPGRMHEALGQASWVRILTQRCISRSISDYDGGRQSRTPRNARPLNQCFAIEKYRASRTLGSIKPRHWPGNRARARSNDRQHRSRI